jgi:hypothetical protein
MATATAPDSEIKIKIGKMIFYITDRSVVLLLVRRHPMPLLSRQGRRNALQSLTVSLS